MPRKNSSDIINRTGRRDAVKKSVHEICTISDELSMKAVERIKIPSVYHPYIIGEGSKKNLMKETGANIHVSPPRDRITVIGDKEGVQLAIAKIKQIYENLATSIVLVPKEHHCYLIGKNGARHKKIEKQTGTEILIPNIRDTSNIINVTGARDAVEKAVQEIRMISDELSKKEIVRIEIPRIYHPFITGGHNENIKNLIKETGVKIIVPPPYKNRDKIAIAGDKEGVQLAMEKIKQIYEKMEKESVICFVEIPKQKHKFLRAKKRTKIQDILLETNVSVEMPRLNSSEETITLRGLRQDLDGALTRLYEAADNMTSETIKCPLEMGLTKFFETANSITSETIECPLDIGLTKLDETANSITSETIECPLDIGLTKLDETANSITSETIECPLDIGLTKLDESANNMTSKIIECPRWIHKLLNGKNGSNLRKLIKDNEKVYVMFSDDKIIVEGPTKNIVSNVIDLLMKDIDSFKSIEFVVEL